MDFRVLGAIEIYDGNRHVPLCAAKQLAVLATGLLEANTVVAAPRFIDAVWADDPPLSASALLQTYISALRRLFKQYGGSQIVQTRAPGYFFHITPGQLDLHRFEALAAAGRAAAEVSQHAQAARDLQAALALWHGPALDGMNSPILANAAVRLDEMRLDVLEQRVEQDIHLGRLEPLAAELGGLVRSHPLRERFRAQQMVTLYRLGRQADALQAYDDGRRMLSGELGVDPSPDLQRLHQAILRAEDHLLCGSAVPRRDRTPLGPPPRDATVVPPSQLPPTVADLSGRDDEMAAISALLSSSRVDHPTVCVIEGRAGSGKTALAVTAAQAHKTLFPDGQLFANLRGADPAKATPPADVLAAFLRSLGVAPALLPEESDERSALFRSLISGRRVLILLDDAASASQIQPLLPGHASAAVIVTSRKSMPGLRPQLPLYCDVLSLSESVTMLGALVGDDRLAVEPDAGAEIAALCGGMPLALRIAGARLAARRSWPLAVLAARLRDEQRRLDELVAGDLEVRATLALTCQAISPSAQAAFHFLGVLAPLEFSPWLLAAIADVPIARAEHLSEQFADAHLIEPAGCTADGTVRYRIHDLVRLYARERAAQHLPAEQQREAMRRLMTQMLTLVRAARGQAASLLAVSAEAWFTLERQNLVSAVELASRLELHGLACDVSAALLAFYQRQNTFDDWWRTHDAALAAARAAGDQRGEATLLRGLGRLRYEQDRLSEARHYYQRAEDICNRHDDSAGLAAALLGTATIDREQCRFVDALQGLDRARSIFARVPDLTGMADCDYGTGYIHRERGDFTSALAHLDRALLAYQTMGDRRGVGLTMRSLSLLHRAAGQLAQAEARAQSALAVFREIGDGLLTAYGAQALAKARIRRHQFTGVGEPLHDALGVCQDYGDRFGCALMLRTLGELSLASGDLATADRHLRASLALWQELDLEVFQARVNRDLAVLEYRRGNLDLSSILHADALEKFKRAGTREHGELLTAGPSGTWRESAEVLTAGQRPRHS